MPEAQNITLREPIVLDPQSEQKWENLELYEPTAGQMAEADKAGGTHDVNIKLISLCARVPEAVARRLPATEYRRCLTFLGSFTRPAPATGGGSLQE